MLTPIGLSALGGERSNRATGYAHMWSMAKETPRALNARAGAAVQILCSTKLATPRRGRARVPHREQR